MVFVGGARAAELASPVGAPLLDHAADNLIFFENKVRPLLADHCYECHGEKKQKGGLRLDSQPGWQKGGESGAVIVPGHPDTSLLIEAIHYKNEDLQMPPKQPLSAPAIAILTEWVRRGAPDPRLTTPVATGTKIIAMTPAEARSHWAYQPITFPPVPVLPNAAPQLNALDQFVRARLAQEGLTPNPPADPRTLVRRAYLTLIGLPPSFERVEQFAAQPTPAAFAELVDQLLARPEYVSVGAATGSMLPAIPIPPKNRSMANVVFPSRIPIATT